MDTRSRRANLPAAPVHRELVINPSPLAIMATPMFPRQNKAHIEAVLLVVPPFLRNEIASRASLGKLIVISASGGPLPLKERKTDGCQIQSGKQDR